MAMPDEVPVLTADDMCVGPYLNGRCGCLLYHTDRNFSYSVSTDEYWAVERAMRRAWRDMDRRPESYRGPGRSWITDECDADRISESVVARVWNRAMAYLGYVVGNPECTARGTLRKVRK